jgi:hypothetical protein
MHRERNKNILLLLGVSGTESKYIVPRWGVRMTNNGLWIG